MISCLCSLVIGGIFYDTRTYLASFMDNSLSLSTGGRFVLRFGTTPSDEGRGNGEDKLRRAIDRAVNE